MAHTIDSLERTLYMSGTPIATTVVMKGRSMGRTEPILTGKQIYDYYKGLRRKSLPPIK